ncbi:transmembrane protein 244 isoform X3 [Falco cherrug]|uniref:transmembrane protein 244 isoform X3 n=1 Tax=Falco cherrug TaxID=345164 RepID=UPI00247B0DD5|nr:transmembrane protein 244 isoform X3 [Falco cherrug]
MASVSMHFNPINPPHSVLCSPIRMFFLGENQLLLPADVGVRNIATALPFNIMCPWLSRSKLLKVVLVNLLICMVVFYTVYYVVLSVCFAVFRIKMLDGLAPFDFKTNPSWINPYYLVLVISLEITFFICGLLFALIVEEWVWDYAVTVTIIHIIITSVGKKRERIHCCK